MSGSEPVETLKAAATIYRGKMFEGVTHPTILVDIEDFDPSAKVEECIEGFVTTTGRFLSREEAKTMAHEQNLLRPGRDKWIDKKLWTEYLPYDVFHKKDGVE